MRLRFALVPCVLAGMALAQAHPVSLLDIMRLKSVSDAQISPNGQWVLYTVRAWTPEPQSEAAATKPPKETMRSHVWIVSATDPAGTGAARQLTFGDKGESAPEWSPDGKYISFVADRGPADGAGGTPAEPQIYVMRSDGGEARQLTRGRGGAGAYTWAPDSQTIAFLRHQPLSAAAEGLRKAGDDAEVYEGDFRPVQIWTVTVGGGAERNLTGAIAMTIKGAPAWSPDGRQIAFAAAPTPLLRDNRTNLYMMNADGSGERQLTHGVSPSTDPAWSPDGKQIAYLHVPDSFHPLGDGIPFQDEHRTRLTLLDVASGVSTDAAMPDFDLSAGAPLWTPDGKQIEFDTGKGVYNPVYSYDLATHRTAQISRDEVISLSNGALSRDGATAAYVRQSATSPGDVFVIGAKGAPRQLTHMNPQAADFQLGSTQILHWKSADGWPVEGILVKPLGYEAGHRYPLLVRVHGGPTSAFLNSYNLDAQFWAGKGWAVLFTNPRGSTGYGEKFLRGNLNDWGGGDYHDIMSGVDAVVAAGVADPDKMAEWGWSYGGYMTCWIVSQTHRFKAAMMGAGLSDLVSMYGSTDIPDYLGGFFDGYPDAKTLAAYRERSGLTYVDQVTTPLLMLQGAVDERVPTSQSLEFFRALKDRGKTVELVFYPREHHGFTEYYHQLDRMQRIYDWIAHYTLGEGPVAPAGLP